MKIEEKILEIRTQLDLLSEKYGDYAVRRALKRWTRELSISKYREKDRLKRMYRSVWVDAIRDVFRSKEKK